MFILLGLLFDVDLFPDYGLPDRPNIYRNDSRESSQKSGVGDRASLKSLVPKQEPGTWVKANLRVSQLKPPNPKPAKPRSRTCTNPAPKL